MVFRAIGICMLTCVTSASVAASDDPLAAGAAGVADAAGVAGAAGAAEIQPGATTQGSEAAPAVVRDTAAGEKRRVTGRLVDATTGEGVAGAALIVRGTQVKATTDEDGNFVLGGAPDGAFDVVLRRDGYRSTTVQIGAGQAVFSAKLKREGVEEIVVTGRATRIAKKNLPNSVSRVMADQLRDVSAQTLTEALAGKVAGANIQANSGAPGGGIQMQLRGVSTIHGRAAPLYVVDGIIVSDAAIASGISAVSGSTAGSSSAATQDNQVNRIADLNPYDIESIEVLKGASAASIYGSKASNGVVIITTKRGKVGAPRVRVTQRLGAYTPANKLGSRAFETREEAVEANADLAQYYVDGKSYDHEAQLTRQRKLSTETALSVSGGTPTTDYYASLLIKDDAAVIPGTGYQKQSGRITVGQRFGERLTVRGTANIIHSNASRGLTNNDNNDVSHYMVLSATPRYVKLGRKAGVYPVNPAVSSGTNPLQTVALMSDEEDVWRFIGGLNATWDIWSDDNHRLDFIANAGVDRFQQNNTLVFPADLHFAQNDGYPGGTVLRTSTPSLNLNVDANIVHVYEDDMGNFAATTSAGFQFEQRGVDALYLTSQDVAPGLSNLDAGTRLGSTQHRSRIRDRGFYLQEELVMLDESLTLVGGMRGEQSSVNGDPNAVFFYPKAAAAYRLPWLLSAFDDVKLRMAYGEAGNLPLYGQKFRSLNSTIGIEGNPALISKRIIGDPGIKPERQREFEAGVDVLAFGEKLSIEFSVYQRNISDLLLERIPAASTGNEVEYINGGELRNRGVEMSVAGQPVKVGRFAWTSRATFALNRSRVLDLPVPAFSAGGFRTSLGEFRIEEGRSATQIVGNVDGNGTVAQLGDSEPDFRAGFYNNMTWGAFNLGMLLDWQRGGDIINLTRLLYDANGNSVDYETGGAARINAFGEGQTGVYIEDASFLKLRELVLSYDVPSELLDAWGNVAKNARVSISGRNLLTFTNYSGLDPEVSNFGNQQVGRNIDVAPYPPMRSFWFSITAGI